MPTEVIVFTEPKSICIHGVAIVSIYAVFDAPHVPVPLVAFPSVAYAPPTTVPDPVGMIPSAILVEGGVGVGVNVIVGVGAGALI